MTFGVDDVSLSTWPHLLIHFIVSVFILSSSDPFKCYVEQEKRVHLGFIKFAEIPSGRHQHRNIGNHNNATNLVASRDRRCFNRLLWADYDNILREIRKGCRGKFTEELLGLLPPNKYLSRSI